MNDFVEGKKDRVDNGVVNASTSGSAIHWERPQALAASCRRVSSSPSDRSRRHWKLYSRYGLLFLFIGFAVVDGAIRDGSKIFGVDLVGMVLGNGDCVCRIRCAHWNQDRGNRRRFSGGKNGVQSHKRSYRDCYPRGVYASSFSSAYGIVCSC